MSKNRKRFVCTECGSIHSKWHGQCPECQAWGMVEEELNATEVNIPQGTPQKIEMLQEQLEQKERLQTSIGEFNRCLGGGLVSGSFILIGGEPGIGKSTLLLQVAAALAEQDIGCLYVTGEESPNQIKLRAKRLGLSEAKVKLIAATNVENIVATIEEHKKGLRLVIIDSIQTMNTKEISSPVGSVSQIKATSQLLTSYAKSNDIILLMSCHVNKEGQLAGPKILEHMVDTVLYFEGDQHHHFRLLRANKNRFGSVNEIGVFEMQESGLKAIDNPSELFLMERENNVSGTAVFAGIEGSRPLLIEVQALISPTSLAMPRRSVVGWDPNRLSMIIAVLNSRFGLNLANFDVYLSIAGGLKINEPAVDLAVAAALVSAAKDQPLPKNSVFFGEIGLSGELRRVSRAEERLKEARKLGFANIYCSPSENVKDVNVINHIKQLKNI